MSQFREDMEAAWQRLFTSRDQQILAKTPWAKKSPFGLGERPAVIVIDPYYAALGLPRSDVLDSIEQWPASCGLDGWQAVDRTANLLAAARSNGIPIIYVNRIEKFPTWSRSVRAAISSPFAARASDIVQELEPATGDLIIGKSAPSAFQGTPLLFALQKLLIDTVVICGEVTSGCVRASAVDAATHRFQVAVVGDCCFDRFESSHWMSLFDLDQKYADVIDIAASTAYFDKVGANRN